RIVKHRDNKIIEEIIYNLHKKEIRVFTIEDPEYPKSLLYIHDKPTVLYSKGNFIDEKLSIAIVGSRKSTAYGKWACEKFAKGLAKLGITIVSGLAQGIDTIAHK